MNAFRAHKTPREFPVEIILNNKKIDAHDPLYVRTEKTAFPSDEKAQEFTIVFSWPSEGDPDVTIRLSFFAGKLEKKVGDGDNEFASTRKINENEGFSIIRAGREVFYDWIPRFGRQSDTKDRWWGCEIHFDPELDESFAVKNIKRGAVPTLNLKRRSIRKSLLL